MDLVFLDFLVMSFSSGAFSFLVLLFSIDATGIVVQESNKTGTYEVKF